MEFLNKSVLGSGTKSGTFLGVVQKVLFSGNTVVAMPPSEIRDMSIGTMEWQQAC
jgi:hypothetical protein